MFYSAAHDQERDPTPPFPIPWPLPLRPSPDPPYEDIDTISLDDLKQDACLRAIIALRRAGKPIGPDTDPVAAFDAEPYLVRRVYGFAYRDALRLQLGRGILRGRRLARWQRRLSLDHGFADIADPKQQEALDAVIDEVVATTRLTMLWGMGLPNLTVKQTRRLIRLLQELQRRKAEGPAVIPNNINIHLHRLRQATGRRLPTRNL